MFKKIQGIYNFGKNVITGGSKKSETISSVPISKNIKKFTDQKEKIINTVDKYSKKVDTPEAKMKMKEGTSKTLSNISKIYKGEPITKKVKKVEKKAMGGRIGYKDGNKGGGISDTQVKKKFKNLGNLPESIQIKIAGKKIAKKV
jgi:hypothetical protein